VRRVVTGLEILVEDPFPLRGRSWAMVCNHASVLPDLEPGRAALAVAAGPPVLLFAPEHGIEGVAQDMEGVEDQTDPLTGLPVRSLYGSTAASLEPRPEDLAGLDVVVVDLPDIGTRYYTFAATMDAVMAACERAGVEVVVADRPDPLGGVVREGGPVRPGFESFVGCVPVPVRHGLTLGEMALLLHRERYPGLELTVIPCRGWRRRELFDDTGLPWVAPSPNMPTLETALLYPGLCLVEATTLSEGRGTTRPFKLVGAPGLDAPGLAAALRGLPGVAVRPAWFRPAFGKHAGELCSGVELAVTDRDVLRPLELGLHLLEAARRLSPELFGWRAEAYEFVEDVPARNIKYDESLSPDWKMTWDLARRLYQEKKYKEALVQYEILLGRKENVCEARWEYTSILLLLERWEQACEQLDQLLTVEPENKKYLFAQGNASLQCGRIDRAASHSTGSRSACRRLIQASAQGRKSSCRQ